jgi:hypothetical protein
MAKRLHSCNSRQGILGVLGPETDRLELVDHFRGVKEWVDYHLAQTENLMRVRLSSRRVEGKELLGKLRPKAISVRLQFTYHF